MAARTTVLGSSAIHWSDLLVRLGPGFFLKHRPHRVTNRFQICRWWGPLVLGDEEMTYFFASFWVARAVWPEPLQFALSCWNVRWLSPWVSSAHDFSACSSVAWSRFRFPCWFLRPQVYENQRRLTNRADGRQDHHWSGLLGPEDWAVLVRHASAVSCGRSRGWNWCGWKTYFHRRPVAAVLGPWRAA